MFQIRPDGRMSKWLFDTFKSISVLIVVLPTLLSYFNMRYP